MLNVGVEWSDLAMDRASLFWLELMQKAQDGSPAFGKDFFEGEYATLLKSQIDSIDKSYFRTFRSFDGYDLTGRRRIRIEFVESFDVNAWIDPPSDNSFTTISVTLGYFICLDFLSSLIVLHDFGDFAPNLPPVEIDQFCASMLTNVASSSGMIAAKEFCKVVRSGDTEVMEAWATCTNYALYWLLSHELAHYACGHLGYMVHQRRDSGYYPVAQLFDARLNHEKYINDTELNDAIVMWCAELMADSYATIQLMMHLTADIRQTRDYEKFSDNDRANDLRKTCVLAHRFCFVPSLIVHSERMLGSRTGRNKYGTHPKPLTRLFNIASTIDFFMRPIANTGFDMRANPAFDYVHIDKGPPPGSHRFHQCSANIHVGHWYFTSWAYSVFEISRVRAAAGNTKVEPFSPQQAYEHTRVWMQNVFIARLGIAQIDCSDFEDAEYNEAIVLWARIMRLLCTNVNGRFSWHAPRNWTAEIGLNQGLKMHPEHKIALGIKTSEQEQKLLDAQNKSGNYVNDPTYKILDDWMSNIQFCSTSQTEEELKFFVDQETQLAKMFDTQIRRSMKRAKPNERSF